MGGVELARRETLFAAVIRVDQHSALQVEHTPADTHTWPLGGHPGGTPQDALDPLKSSRGSNGLAMWSSAPQGSETARRVGITADRGGAPAPFRTTAHKEQRATNCVI
jgi:hypothetical protein